MAREVAWTRRVTEELFDLNARRVRRRDVGTGAICISSLAAIRRVMPKSMQVSSGDAASSARIGLRQRHFSSQFRSTAAV